jgi:hypothetical protein
MSALCPSILYFSGFLLKFQCHVAAAILAASWQSLSNPAFTSHVLGLVLASFSLTLMLKHDTAFHAHSCIASLAISFSLLFGSGLCLFELLVLMLPCLLLWPQPNLLPLCHPSFQKVDFVFTFLAALAVNMSLLWCQGSAPPSSALASLSNPPFASLPGTIQLFLVLAA